LHFGDLACEELVQPTCLPSRIPARRFACYPVVRLLHSLLALFLLAFASSSLAQSSSEIAALLRGGQAALDSGKFAEAVQQFSQAHELAPQSREAARGLTLSYLQAGQIADATRFGRDFVSQWPNDPQLQHWFGLACFKAGQVPAARQALEQAEKLDSTSA